MTGNSTVEEEHVRYQRCSKQLGTITSCGHLEHWENELWRSPRNLFHNKNQKTSGLTHGDDFVVTGSKASLLELKKWLESVYPIKANIIWRGSARIKVLNRRIRWGETGIVYQNDLRHVDVLVESLELENGNTVQTPTVDDVKDENPVWLDPEQIRKYRSVAMPDSSSNSSSSDSIKVSPSQRYSGDGIMTLNELQDLIDEVNAFGNGTNVSESLSVLLARKDKKRLGQRVRAATLMMLDTLGTRSSSNRSGRGAQHSVRQSWRIRLAIDDGRQTSKRSSQAMRVAAWSFCCDNVDQGEERVLECSWTWHLLHSCTFASLFTELLCVLGHSSNANSLT